MKRFSLGFAVAFVLFSFQGGFSRPTKSQLDSLEALIPTLVNFSSYIRYDSVEVYGDTVVTESTHVGATNYWIGQRFTPTISSFTLQGVHFQVANPLINYMDSCQILVMSDSMVVDGEDTLHLPKDTLHQDTVPAPLPNRLFSFVLDSTLKFGQNINFWIMLGPVPGGADNDSIGQGWWALSDCRECSSKTSNRSLINLSGDIFEWVDYYTGYWVLRAGGEYIEPPPPVVNEVLFAPDPSSGDPTRNHEWVELYNPGPILSATGWQLANGGGPSQITGVAAKVFSLPNFQFSAGAYLVVHFTTGTNDLNLSDGRGDIYTGNVGEFFGDMIDACGFRFGPTPEPYVDIVAWNLKNLSKDPNAGSQTSIEASGDFNALNKVGRVQPVGAIGPLLTATKGISIGRNSSSSNPVSSPNGINLNLLGGPNAAGPTMGRQNILPMVIDTSNINSSAVPNAERTIMLYFAADNGAGADAQERWCYDLLNEVERSIPASPQNVNVVVWFDSRRAYPINNPSDTGVVFRGMLRQDATDIVRNLERLQELNSGSAASLEGFITWAKANFPADKYVLALKGDGAGWQGLCGDAASLDRLEMGELKSALQTGLGTDTLELLIFDAPLMSQLEVAVQVQNFARAMVASPEMTGPADFDYRRLVSNMEGGALAVETPDSVAKNVVGTILGPRRTVGDLYWTWVALRLDSDSLGLLLDTLEVLASNLQTGVEDRCQVGTASNNFQLFIRNQLKISDHYGGQAQGMADFVDLKSFCFTLGYFSNPHVSCADSNRHGARGVDSLLRTVEQNLPPSPVLLAQSLQDVNGRHYANSGISIYFPSSRQNVPPIQAAQKLAPAPPVFRDSSEHSFDNPGLAAEGGVFNTLRVYAADSIACYPNDGTPCPRDSSDMLAQIYPHPPVPDFDFVQQYSWDEFLIRYYKPVADAGVTSGAANIGAPFPLDGSGSSDADDEPSALQFFWDIDDASDDDLVNCTDYASEDMDKDCSDDNDDDRDTSEVTAGAIFQSPGLTTVTLNVWDGYDSDSSINSGRRYQTAKSTVGVLVNSPDAWVVALDNTLPSDFYESWVDRIPGVFPNRTRLFTCSERDNQSLVNQIAFQGEEPIFWQTGRVGSCLFPTASLNVLTTRLVDSVKPRGVWVFAPKLGVDPDYQAGNLRSLFRNYFGLDTILSAQSSTMLLPANPALPVFQGWDTIFPIQLKTAPDTLAADLTPLVSRCTTEVRFPLLKDQLGNVVAIAAIEDLGGVKRGRILSSFGLEHIRLDSLADTLKLDVLLANLHQWMFEPDEGIAGGPCCPADKGDLNGIDSLTVADVVLMQNCVFIGSGIGTVDGTCDLCFTDVDCNGELTATDAVLEMNRILLGLTAPPWCGQ